MIQWVVQASPITLYQPNGYWLQVPWPITNQIGSGRGSQCLYDGFSRKVAWPIIISYLHHLHNKRWRNIWLPILMVFPSKIHCVGDGKKVPLLTTKVVIMSYWRTRISRFVYLVHRNWQESNKLKSRPVQKGNNKHVKKPNYIKWIKRSRIKMLRNII